MKDSTLKIIDKAKIIDKYLINLFVLSMIECTGDSNITAVRNSEVSDIDPAIAIQFFYNRKADKCFLEFRFNKIFRENYENFSSSIISRFDDYILANFSKENKGTWLEQLLPEDGNNEDSDGSQLLTPFTIGYWKSLSGRYDFIVDKIKILKDYNDMVFPQYPAEYETKKEQIWSDFNSGIIDFETFNQRMYDLAVEYDIKLDPTFRKNFEDFIETVKTIDALYSQVQLTEEEKAEFINSYMEIFAQYHSDPLILKEKLEELYNEYSVVQKLNDKIPEIFENYKEEYENFFEKPLTTMDLVNNLSEFQEHEEEWQLEDFNFSNVADPNDNSESIIVTSYFDIITNEEESEEENED